MTVEKSEAQKWSPRDTDGGKRGSRLEKPRRASDGKKKKKKKQACLVSIFTAHWVHRASEFLLLSDQQVDWLIYLSVS